MSEYRGWYLTDSLVVTGPLLHNALYVRASVIHGRSQQMSDYLPTGIAEITTSDD